MDITPLGYATFLYDDAGNRSVSLQRLHPTVFRSLWTRYPLSLQHAVVAIEDERFYEHNGIDVQGIARAGMKAITTGNFSEGASTITQQLLKNNVFTDWANRIHSAGNVSRVNSRNSTLLSRLKKKMIKMTRFLRIT